jgi:translation initiation factor eIF-2B subunit gamma
MLTTHRDAHIYIFPRWIMQFIKDNESLESIGEDVIGWWAKAGWQAGLSEKLGLKKIFEKRAPHEDGSTNKNGSPPSPSDADAEELGVESAKHGQFRKAITAAEVNDHFRNRDSLLPKPTQGQIPPILAYVHPSQPTAPLVRRVDTAQLLLATSLHLAKLPSVEEVGVEGASPFAHARKVAYPDGVKTRTTITRQDSLVAENVTVGEKTSIKESVVGANCQINEGAKLSQCLLMEGVVVGKNCKLTRCILGRRSGIGEGSVLTDCEVQENLLVENRSKCISLRWRHSRR